MHRVVWLLLLVLFAGCSDPEAERAKAAAAEEARAAETRAREAAAARREAERLADLWTYSDTPAGKGRQLSTYLYSSEPVDTDGQGAKRVQLVFRDHAEWGRSSYLVLQGGDFNCYAGCQLNVTVNDGAPVRMAGRRPKTDEAIAMFINDWHRLWTMTNGATTIRIEFPVRAGGTRTAVFEVSGLDRSKMPGWDAAAR